MADLKIALADFEVNVSGQIQAISNKLDLLGRSGVPEGSVVFSADEQDQAIALLTSVSDEVTALKAKADSK